MPWHAPVFLLNSRLGRFSAAGLCSPWRVTYYRHPLSRSYGVILPSSFSVNHSSPLGCSPRPPVSVYGTDILALPTELFSPVDSTEIGIALRRSLSIRSRPFLRWPTPLDGHPQNRFCFVPVSLCGSSRQDGTGISTRYPSATPLGPHLRVRLTLR